MATKYVTPESAPLQLHILQSKPITESSLHAALTKFHAETLPSAATSSAASSSSFAHTKNSTKVALAPATSFQIAQVIENLAWEMRSRPSERAVLKPSLKESSRALDLAAKFARFNKSIGKTATTTVDKAADGTAASTTATAGAVAAKVDRDSKIAKAGGDATGVTKKKKAGTGSKWN